MGIARFLPWRSFEIHTSRTPEGIVHELARSVGPRGSFLQRPTTPWMGEVSIHHLSLVRVIHYRNSFLPVITAQIEREASGARVKIRMRMHAFVMVFMAYWMTGATLGGSVGLYAAITGGNPAGLIALLFPIAGFALCAGAFAHEAKKAEDFLRGALPPVPWSDDPYR